MSIGVTRRAVLGVLPSIVIAATSPPPKRAKALPQVGEFVRFSDPTTEAIVVRLTDQRSNSLFPGPNSRFVSLKDRFLVFSSDRSGKSCPFRLDLHTGALTQLAQTVDLQTDSLTLDDKARFLYFIDAGRLSELNLASKKIRVLGENVAGFSMVGSAQTIVAVMDGRLESLDSETVLAEEVNGACAVRPGGRGCFFSRAAGTAEQEFWYTPFPEASGAKPVLLAQGPVSNPVWSPEGRSLLFLRSVLKGEAKVAEIHEAIPESGVEQRVEVTSQFAAFAPNGDATVFVGASSSKAQPNVILLLRSVQRELTLCEHRSSRPMSVAPIFSPDSRRVYFQSDHGGKSALYSVNVEQLVEPT